MPRGRYQRIENVDRQRIVNAFLEGRDWRQVAETLQIKRQSARNVIVNFRRNGSIDRQKQGGHRYSKIDEEMLNFVIDLVEEKPTITLQEMCDRLGVTKPGKPRITPQQAIRWRNDHVEKF